MAGSGSVSSSSETRGGDPVLTGTATEHGVVPLPLASDLRVGTKLGAYELDELIGRGGMGVVYRARHVHLGRPVALKLLAHEAAEDAGFRERFVRESQTAASLDHPNIVSIYDAGEAEGLLYIAMQYVDGGDLAARLRECGALDPEEALSIVAQVGGALDAAHAGGIVHRDVKPANVLLDDEHAYLTDFGLTRQLSSRAALTQVGQFVGTIDYMPPEQIEGRDVDARADIYALGALFFHVLVGSVPYERESQVSTIYAHLNDPAPSPAARREGLPSALDQVVAKAMAKRSGDRYASCAELVTAARAAFGNAGAAGPPAAVTAKQRTALVADAEASVRTLVRISLEHEGFTVYEADDGASAEALSRQERPELVLVDWRLPGREPGGVHAALRQQADPARTHVVALVSRTDAVDEAVRGSGALGYLRKPFSPMQLLYVIHASAN